MGYLFTSESVSEGQPDKVADQISDAVLDRILAFDPEAKVACETLVTTGQTVIAGEIKTKTYVDVQQVARELGVTSKDVREMESRMAAQDMTFDLSSDDDSDSQPMAPVLYLQDKSSNFADGIEDDNWEEQAANRLTDAMQGLDERSQDIIRARWLDEDNKSTLQELADRYGVSAERVRQLEKNAMKKLRAAIEA